MTNTDWAVVGATAVMIDTSGWTSRIVGESTITKVGKRDIVLANGRRFKVANLEEQGRTFYGARLVAEHDPVLREIRAENRAIQARRVAADAVNSWQAHKSEDDYTLEAITALVETLPSSPTKTALRKALDK